MQRDARFSHVSHHSQVSNNNFEFRYNSELNASSIHHAQHRHMTCDTGKNIPYKEMYGSAKTQKTIGLAKMSNQYNTHERRWDACDKMCIDTCFD